MSWPLSRNGHKRLELRMRRDAPGCKNSTCQSGGVSEEARMETTRAITIDRAARCPMASLVIACPQAPTQLSGGRGAVQDLAATKQVDFRF